MPQVTLSVPNEKLPLLQDFLSSLRIEDRKVITTTPHAGYRSSLSRSVKETANSFYKKYLTWEYFSNELEFE